MIRWKIFLQKNIQTGNPIRESIKSNKNLVNQRKLNIKEDMTATVLGGSLGSGKINKQLKKI